MKPFLGLILMTIPFIGLLWLTDVVFGIAPLEFIVGVLTVGAIRFVHAWL